MSGIVRWETPVQERRKGSTAAEIESTVAELKQRPGQWAVVNDNSSSGAVTLSWRSRGCETTLRTIPGTSPKRFVLYARWPGDPS